MIFGGASQRAPGPLPPGVPAEAGADRDEVAEVHRFILRVFWRG